MRYGRYVPLLSALCLLATTCFDGTDPGDATPGTVRGRVMTVPDSLPVYPSTIALLHGEDLTVVAGPVQANTTGSFTLDGVPPGDYCLLAYSGNYFIFDRSSPFVHVTPGDTVEQTIRLMPSSLWGSANYQIAGTVKDAATGVPIARAFVSCMIQSIELNSIGFNTPWETVTDQNGRYVIRAFGSYQGLGGPTISLQPITVSKEGYTVFISEDIPVPDGPDSTAILDVLLAQDRHFGTIVGSVQYNGSPLEGILVGLDCYRDIFGGEPGKSEGPVLGKAVRTDSKGGYRFDGLPAGFYTVEAAYLPGDGFVDPHKSGSQVSLAEGQSVHLDPVNLLLAMEPVFPPPRSHFTSKPLRFEWTAHPLADNYKLWTTFGHIFGGPVRVDTTEYVFPCNPDALYPDLAVRWYVDAFAGTTLVGTFDGYGTFTFDGNLDSVTREP